MPSARVNLYDDPDTGTRIPFAIASLTGMFYDPATHRLYYTVSGDARLYYRYFTPESEMVGAQTFTADAGGVELRQRRRDDAGGGTHPLRLLDRRGAALASPSPAAGSPGRRPWSAPTAPGATARSSSRTRLASAETAAVRSRSVVLPLAWSRKWVRSPARNASSPAYAQLATVVQPIGATRALPWSTSAGSYFDLSSTRRPNLAAPYAAATGSMSSNSEDPLT